MPLENVFLSVGTLISVIGGVWLLSRQLGTLASDNTNTKEDVKELKVSVGELSEAVAVMKGVIMPERMSAPPPQARKRPRR